MTYATYMLSGEAEDWWKFSSQTLPSKEGDDSEGMQEQKTEFARSHSTGHSIVMVRGEGRHADKYTLRLPENVAFKIVKGGHNYSKSCSSSKDMARLAAPCRNCGYVQTVFQSSSSRSDIKNI